MERPVATLDVCRARDLVDQRRLGGVAGDRSVTARRWSRDALSGYLTELVGGSDSANLSMTGRLILHAQTAGELVSWVATRRDVFFPPDYAAIGVDLGAFPVVWAEEPAEKPDANDVRVRTASRAVRAAERLLRSGAFGLVIIDLAPDLTLHPAGQGRLLRLAKENDAQVLILRPKRDDEVYAGSLVMVRGESKRRRVAPGKFRCTIMNTKDKREGPGWTTSEEFDGPPGLC
jgi:recombination protein RecA